jgi:spore maturation protein CgeB
LNGESKRLLAVFGKHAYGDPQRGHGYEYTNFIPAFRRLGYQVTLFDSFARAPYRDFADLNRRFLETLEQVDPDLVFCVLMGYELWSETLQLARRCSRASLIHWATDDSWKYEQFSRYIAPPFDVYATTYPEAREKAVLDGHENFMLNQWAADAMRLAPPLAAAECDILVSFIGANYGNRAHWVKQLREQGIDVHCFGHGWPKGPLDAERLPEIIRRSLVSLNFADSGIQLKGLRPYHSRQIKARVFEIPGAGGLLATQGAEHLQDYLRAGQECLVFETVEELADQIRQLQGDPQLRDRIAMAGYRRVRDEHTYDKRFAKLFEVAKSRSMGRSVATAVDWRAFEVFTAAYQHGPGLGLLRRLMTFVPNLIWGRERGARAARRLLFELSWRVNGKLTYSAGGWPGRLFYRES